MILIAMLSLSMYMFFSESHVNSREVAITRHVSGQCCSLSWQWIVGQIDCAATPQPLTNSTVCMLTIKISRPLRQLYFETSRPLLHHANQLPHVRVPRTGLYLYLFTVCAQCRMPSRLARPNSLTSHFEASLVPNIPAQNL